MTTPDLKSLREALGDGLTGTAIVPKSELRALLAERDALLARLDAVEADARRMGALEAEIVAGGGVLSFGLTGLNLKFWNNSLRAALDSALQDTQP